MKTQMITVAAAALFVPHAALAADNVKAMKSLEAEVWTVPGIDLKMKRIPAGTFTMGSPKEEEYRRDDEVQHEVRISKPFYMGVYEVTQRQFYKLMMPEDYDYEAWQYKRGPLTHGAGVQQHHISLLGRVDRHVALPGQHSSNQLGVCLVHLTPIGFHVDGQRHDTKP